MEYTSFEDLAVMQGSFFYAPRPHQVLKTYIFPSLALNF